MTITTVVTIVSHLVFFFAGLGLGCWIWNGGCDKCAADLCHPGLQDPEADAERAVRAEAEARVKKQWEDIRSQRDLSDRVTAQELQIGTAHRRLRNHARRLTVLEDLVDLLNRDTTPTKEQIDEIDDDFREVAFERDASTVGYDSKLHFSGTVTDSVDVEPREYDLDRTDELPIPVPSDGKHAMEIMALQVQHQARMQIQAHDGVDYLLTNYACDDGSV